MSAVAGRGGALEEVRGPQEGIDGGARLPWDRCGQRGGSLPDDGQGQHREEHIVQNGGRWHRPWKKNHSHKVEDDKLKRRYKLRE